MYQISKTMKERSTLPQTKISLLSQLASPPIYRSPEQEQLLPPLHQQQEQYIMLVPLCFSKLKANLLSLYAVTQKNVQQQQF
jgi:hypothetical protein